MNKSMLIMLAGPYRSGTGDNPQKMAANLTKLEAVAVQLWRMGHTPVIGEWLALPLIKQAGSSQINDSIWQSIAYPLADRLLEHCEGVLRLAGESKGADGDVAQAAILGVKVFSDISQIPIGQPKAGRPL